MINTVLQGDCLELMQQIPDKSIDMILCDLPYGTTACKWDVIIPFEPLWKQYERVIKDNGAIVLTASQPFTSALVMSNPKLFRYEWIWDKKRVTGFQTARIMPMKGHENVLVFYKRLPVYNYQPRLVSKPFGKITRQPSEVYNGMNICEHGKGYPKSIIEFCSPNNLGKDKAGLHPTQKPVALFEYLIKTYTNPGETVLDNCAGSGTTAVACINTGRNFILMEKEEKYVQVINQRIEKALAEKSKTTQGELSL